MAACSVVAQAVAVDDRLQQLGPSTEVVVQGRRVALPGELVDVAQRDVEPLAREEVQRGAQQLVARASRCRWRPAASVLIYGH